MGNGKSFPLSLIVKAVDKATSPLQKINDRIGGLAKTTAKVGAGLTLGVTAPLVALGTAGVLAFSRFETGMANVSTLVDTNVESLDAMGRSVLDISKRVPVKIEELTEALYEERSAGVSAAEQFNILEKSAKLAVVGLGTTKESVDLVTSSMNAFGLKGAEADKIFNLIFQATNTGKTTISGLAQGFGGVAGTVAAAGVQLDEYLASVAALTTTGLPAAQAHTQLKAVIVGLTGQTKEATAIFHRLNVKGFKELIAQSGGLVPALDKIRGVVKSNDKVLLDAVGGAEAFNAVLGLTGGQAASFKSTLETMRSGVDGVSAAFEKQNSTMAAKMQRLHNSLDGVAISVGRILTPALEKLIPHLEGLAAKWENMGSEGQTSIITLAVAAAALGPTLTVLGNLATTVGLVTKAFTFAAGWGQYLWMMRASIISGLVPSLTAATASVWGFTVALLANPITWVVVGVAALAGAAYLIYKNWGPIKGFFVDTWAKITETVGTALAWIGENMGWTPLGQVIKNWEPIKAFFVGLWDGIVSVFKSAWDKIKPIVDALMPATKARVDLATTSEKRLFGPDARPVLGAERAAPANASRSTEARVQVDFANLPPGARVTPAQGNTAPLDLNMGWSMVTP